MAKSIFEQLSGAYEQHGDYFIPYHALLPKKKSLWVSTDSDTYGI